VVVLALTGCATPTGDNGFMGHDGGDGGHSVRNGAAERCERDRGVWRPQIADGYCEVK